MSRPGPNPQLKSDVVRRAPLDSGLIRRQNALGAASGLGGGPSGTSAAEQQTSEQYLTQLNEEWHKRVDHDVRALAVGMGALVQTALLKMPDPARKEENRLKSEEDKIKTRKDKYHAQQDAFQARALAENMALAADSLMSITHSLKIMYLLSDEEEMTTRKAQDLRVVREETARAKEAVASEWDALFKGVPPLDDDAT